MSGLDPQRNKARVQHDRAMKFLLGVIRSTFDSFDTVFFWLVRRVFPRDSLLAIMDETLADLRAIAANLHRPHSVGRRLVLSAFDDAPVVTHERIPHINPEVMDWLEENMPDWRIIMARDYYVMVELPSETDAVHFRLRWS